MVKLKVKAFSENLGARREMTWGFIYKLINGKTADSSLLSTCKWEWSIEFRGCGQICIRMPTQGQSS